MSGEMTTDYYAHQKMVRQEHFHFTSMRCFCKCAYSTFRADVVAAIAVPNEFAVAVFFVSHKNYSAVYTTGLLLTVRVLNDLDLHDSSNSNDDLDDEEYHVEDAIVDCQPFECTSHVSLHRTCVGHRIRGALKSAADDRFHMTHGTKNFPGFKFPVEIQSDLLTASLVIISISTWRFSEKEVRLGTMCGFPRFCP